MMRLGSHFAARLNRVGSASIGRCRRTLCKEAEENPTPEADSNEEMDGEHPEDQQGSPETAVSVGIQREGFMATTGDVPQYVFKPEDPATVEARDALIEEEVTKLQLEEEERVEEDKQVVEENEKLLSEKRGFAERNTRVILKERPYDHNEDDPNPLSPDHLDITDEVLNTIVTHARTLPDRYLTSRLLTKGAEGHYLDTDPNLAAELEQARKDQIDKKKAHERTIEDEIDMFMGGADVSIGDTETRKKFYLDLYENIEELYRHEAYDERAFHDKLRAGVQETSRHEESDDEEPVMKKLGKRAKSIALKQNRDYMESFTKDGSPDPRLRENISAATEEALDTFASKPEYDEFDEFRIKYGLSSLRQDDINPFAPVEAVIASSGESEDEDYFDTHETPVQIQANTLRLSGPTQEILWQLHNKDKGRFTIPRLAKLFELKPYAVKDIIEMKEDEKERIKNGEFTTGLEWWFVQDMEEYRYSDGPHHDYLEVPYAQHMFQDHIELDEKRHHLQIDEIDIGKYEEYNEKRRAWERENKKPSEEMKKYAAKIVHGKAWDVPKSAKSRYNYVFTDLSGRKKNEFGVFVREKDGTLRNATEPERRRAIMMERPNPEDYNRIL